MEISWAARRGEVSTITKRKVEESKVDKREVVIVEVMRTAFGKMGGSLKEFTAEELEELP